MVDVLLAINRVYISGVNVMNVVDLHCRRKRAKRRSGCKARVR